MRNAARGFARKYALIVATGAALCWAGIAFAWDAAGHSTITLLALDRMGQVADCPAWLKDDVQRRMVAWQSSEPDRWRSTKTPSLTHANAPEHYIDLEDLTQFGLTLKTLPKLRNDYLAAMVLAKSQHPELVKPYNPKFDPNHIQEFPGFLPYAIMEHYEKLRSSFHTLRVLEKLPPAPMPELAAQRALQIEQERGNARTEMGILSHFVGDTAQPLHTTTHHHGWTGENPKSYTTEKSIHAYIDGGVLSLHRLGYDTLKAPPARPESSGTPPVQTPIDPENIWPTMLDYIQRSFDKVEPLYVLEKSGELKKEPGKAFITERLTDAGHMLGDLYAAAWKASEPKPTDADNFLKYEAKP
ncbi:MAG: hypothetical protein AABZ53_06635 [Planctomycetota bacterium]